MRQYCLKIEIFKYWIYYTIHRDVEKWKQNHYS